MPAGKFIVLIICQATTCENWEKFLDYGTTLAHFVKWTAALRQQEPLEWKEAA